jgi:hypothetical protein
MPESRTEGQMLALIVSLCCAITFFLAQFMYARMLRTAVRDRFPLASVLLPEN